MCKDKTQCWRDYKVVVHFKGENGFNKSMEIETLTDFKNYFEVPLDELKKFILENDEDMLEEYPDMLENLDDYCIGMIELFSFFENHPEHNAVEFFGDWIVGGDNSSIKEAPNE